MKITLYMAISIDGYIAKKDGDSDWVSEVDTVNFEQKIKEMGCIMVGRRTFDQYQGDLYPVDGVTNIVLSSNRSLSSSVKNVVYVQSPTEALKTAQEKGHNKALLIGGGTTNGMFLNDDLINEVYLSVHPLILGEGIKLFENTHRDINLEFIGQKEIGGGLVQMHYAVK